MPPTLTGQLVVTFTVSDAARSAAWYGELLNGQESSRYAEPNGTLQVVVDVATADLQLCFVSRPDRSSEGFDELSIGLDHLELLVRARKDLAEWCERLDDLGIAHSGIKEPTYSNAAMVTFRDPDNIQLEFYWKGQVSGPPDVEPSS